jgi:hypothetical protein
LRPFDATILGDHRFDHLLDDVSASARDGWLRQQRKSLETPTTSIPVGELSANGKVDFEILRDELGRNIWLAKNTKPFEEDPRTYGSYLNDSV